MLLIRKRRLDMPARSTRLGSPWRASSPTTWSSPSSDRAVPIVAAAPQRVSAPPPGRKQRARQGGGGG
jgi:hypothetical protein